MTHELKIWPMYFERTAKGWKTWELRLNDRNFQVGDPLILKEWNPEKEEYTGKGLFSNIQNLDFDLPGLPGWCMIELGTVYGLKGLQ